MSLPTPAPRIRLSSARGGCLLGHAVNVARPTPWGNPFVVGVDGTAAECVYLFALLLSGRICLTSKATWDAQKRVRDHVNQYLPTIVARPLACWCRIGKPCHADVLRSVAAGFGADGQAGARAALYLEISNRVPPRLHDLT